MGNKIVTFRTFTHPNDAYVLKTKLESEGIQCFLQGVNTVLSNPQFSNAIGGVKLDICDYDFEKATKIYEKLRMNYIMNNRQPYQIIRLQMVMKNIQHIAQNVNQQMYTEKRDFGIQH